MIIDFVYLILHIRELRERPEKPVETPKEAKTTGDSDDNERCWECRRLLNDPDLKMFGGDPDDAVCTFNSQTLKLKSAVTLKTFWSHPFIVRPGR